MAMFGLTPDLHIKSSLIKLYGKLKKVDEAMTLFNQMKEKGIHFHPKRSNDLLSIRARGRPPPFSLLLSLLTASSFLLLSPRHWLSPPRCLSSPLLPLIFFEGEVDSVVFSSLITMYGGTGQFDKINGIFDEINSLGVPVDAGIYNSLMSVRYLTTFFCFFKQKNKKLKRSKHTQSNLVLFRFVLFSFFSL